MFDEQEIQEQYTCLDCGWEGYEEELICDEYDEHNMSMAVPSNCPVCNSENVI